MRRGSQGSRWLEYGEDHKTDRADLSISRYESMLKLRLKSPLKVAEIKPRITIYDPSSKQGATEHAEFIQKFWATRGIYVTIKIIDIWMGGKMYYHVRSNLKLGFKAARLG